ncbi:hypothetical protein B0A48_01865 [Cryoendolithus antarcticus]|uniref:Uncharacterized protein n=1 Tax=Cryoendolithus antarcticus TaxID=1507870 RepID=A0A1V8TQG8_9PEZI|nr:hypothetical protein B0A48_01865 [Cryoendolithus antarcticus]
MPSLTTLLAFFATCIILTTSTPVPTFEEVERRWAKGETELSLKASIHAHHLRHATPSWSDHSHQHQALHSHLHRRRTSADPPFAATTDSLTRAIHERRAGGQKRSDRVLLAKLNDFAARLLRSKDVEGFIGKRAGEVEERGDGEGLEKLRRIRRRGREGVRYRFVERG